MIDQILLSLEHLTCAFGIEGCNESLVKGTEFGSGIFAVSIERFEHVAQIKAFRKAYSVITEAFCQP